MDSAGQNRGRKGEKGEKRGETEGRQWRDGASANKGTAILLERYVPRWR